MESVNVSVLANFDLPGVGKTELFRRVIYLLIFYLNILNMTNHFNLKKSNRLLKMQMLILSVLI